MVAFEIPPLLMGFMVFGLHMMALVRTMRIFLARKSREGNNQRLNSSNLILEYSKPQVISRGAAN